MNASDQITIAVARADRLRNEAEQAAAELFALVERVIHGRRSNPFLSADPDCVYLCHDTIDPVTNVPTPTLTVGMRYGDGDAAATI